MYTGLQASRWFDRLIGESYSRDSEQLYRARVLAGVLSLYIVLMLVTSLYMLLVAPIAWHSVGTAVALQGVMLAGYSYVLYVLRYGYAYRRCVELTVLITLSGIVTGVVVSGGPVSAPASSLLPVPILIAFSLGSVRTGMKWALIVFVVHMGLLALDHWVLDYPQWLDMNQLVSLHVIHWAVTYAAVIFLMLVFEAMSQRLRRERDAERDRFAYMAAHDPLTGLPNRIMFDDQLTRALASSARNKNIVGLMIIDLDGFKPVNDSLGHAAGDLVLKTIATRLDALLRKTDTAARLGGDEFAVIVENVMAPPGVEIVADRIIQEINKPYDGLPAGVKIGASIGIALYPHDTQDDDQLRVFADRAMYVAKKTHNCYRLFSAEMMDHSE